MSWFVIQLGSDFASYEGNEVFDLANAEALYSELYEGLQYVLETGSEEEVQDATVIVNNFRILPFYKH